VPGTVKIYAPLQVKEPYVGVDVRRDVKYGPSERNVADIFRSPTAPSPSAVLIYVHGGGYVRGNRRLAPDSPFYDNIMLWAAKSGMVGINATYRLAPDHPWPAGPEDIGELVAWAKANVPQYGGDPARLFLMGHSAGATHAATHIAKPEFHKGGALGIAGAILVSGTYELHPDAEVAGQKAYFGSDTALWGERSALPGIVSSRAQLFVTYAEVDGPYYVSQSENLKKALCGAQRCPVFSILPGHSHMSEILSINTDDTVLSDQILRFVNHPK
jgi:acetyl esterase/lipase